MTPVATRALRLLLCCTGTYVVVGAPLLWAFSLLSLSEDTFDVITVIVSVGCAYLGWEIGREWINWRDGEC